ncbi:DNA polymerase III subunit chi [Altererythrobacter soli]|uniref:DNA polymerase III subunit chi n=1 Tax=Croceibacterium soli TaxID=1739690 RepID=A0A6I4UVM2_9SPHN|nr:DNA polymerase III subunit chi [Croceibacterium soli]MXP42678.1 DNA polymerase III subunit chi [Croceibacterium soli]
MERVGFYLTGAQPVERVLPLIARAAKKQDQRMLVVAGDEDLLGRLDKALWEQCPEDFLAHGRADAPHAERQPVLLSQECSAANGAALVALADGRWRDEAEQFARALLFFDESGRDSARTVWRRFDERTEVTREFYELDAGKWVKRA